MAEQVRVHVGRAQFDVPAEKADEVHSWLKVNARIAMLDTFQSRFPEATFVTEAPLGGSTCGPMG